MMSNGNSPNRDEHDSDASKEMPALVASTTLELVGLLVRGLDDDIHSAIDVLKIITTMTHTAKRKQLLAYTAGEHRTATTDKSINNLNTTDDDNASDAYGVAPSDVVANEQDWGRAGLYHNLLQGIIVRASKFAAATSDGRVATYQDELNNPSLTTPPRNQTGPPSQSSLVDFGGEDPHKAARSLIEFVEHAAHMFLVMSDAFHPMVAKLMVELCFEYILNVESIACAHPWLMMLVGPIVMGLATDPAEWDMRLIELAVARHPKALTPTAARLLRDPIAMVQELRFALTKFLASYVASERVLEGLSSAPAQASSAAALVDSDLVGGGNSLRSPSVVAPASSVSPLMKVSRSPQPAAATTGAVVGDSSARVERLSLLALGREAEKIATERRERSPENLRDTKRAAGAATTVVGSTSPLSQTALELHNLQQHHAAAQNRGGSITPGGILVPRLDIPRIFKGRGNDNARGVLDASPERPPYQHHTSSSHVEHQSASSHHHHHHALISSGASSGMSPSAMQRQSIDFLGPHVGDSLMRQYGIAEHMKLRWKHQNMSAHRARQQVHSTRTDAHDDGAVEHSPVTTMKAVAARGSDDGNLIATDPFHLQQLVVCGHKLGQLFGTVDAKMLLRFKKDHEALVAAHELEASSSAFYSTTSGGGGPVSAFQTSLSLGVSQVLSTSMVQHNNQSVAGLGNSMALRLSLGRFPSVSRLDEHQLPAVLSDGSRQGLGVWAMHGVDRIGSAFTPSPAGHDLLMGQTPRPAYPHQSDFSDDTKKQCGAAAARLAFRELAMVVLQGLAGYDDAGGNGGGVAATTGTANGGFLSGSMAAATVAGYTPQRQASAHRLSTSGGGGSMLLPASLAQQQQALHHTNSNSASSPMHQAAGHLSGRRGSYASSVDGPATVVGSPSRATLLDGGSVARVPPSAIAAASVSPTRSHLRDDDVSPPTAAETDAPPPPTMFGVRLVHGARCSLALLRNLRFESMRGIATPLLLGFQLMDALESRNVAFLNDLVRLMSSFALDGEAALFSLFREPTSLVGYPTMSGPVSDRVPKDAFLELWVSVVTSLLEITSPIPYDAIAWSLASLCYILKHLPSSCAYVIQAAVVCANVIHDVLDLLRKHVSFHFSFACCVHYALELFDIFLGIQKPSEVLIAVFVSMFASSPASSPINAFLKTYVRRVATAEDAWSLFREDERGDRQRLHPQQCHRREAHPERQATYRPQMPMKVLWLGRAYCCAGACLAGPSTNYVEHHSCQRAARTCPTQCSGLAHSTSSATVSACCSTIVWCRDSFHRATTAATCRLHTKHKASTHSTSSLTQWRASRWSSSPMLPRSPGSQCK